MAKSKNITTLDIDKALQDCDDRIQEICGTSNYTDIEACNPDELYSICYDTLGETLRKLADKKNIMVNMDVFDADVLLNNLDALLDAEYEQGNTETKRYLSLKRTRDKVLQELTAKDKGTKKKGRS